jgi:hypothetical protein
MLRHLNWDEVVRVHPLWRPEGWRLWALWPSPVDHDLCFGQAGFSDFDDNDDAWHTAFAELINDLLAALHAYGRPLLNAGSEYPIERGRRRETLQEALLAAASDDNFRPCTVSFGSPPRALVRTSDGHPILWIALETGAFDQLLALADHYGGAHKLELDWSKLL